VRDFSQAGGPAAYGAGLPVDIDAQQVIALPAGFRQ
jgi:hypothetical protein